MSRTDLPDESGPDRDDGPEADRLLAALRGEGDDPVLARVGRALTDLGPEDRAEAPPPELWSRISEALAAEETDSTTEALAAEETDSTTEALAAEETGSATRPGGVADLAARRRGPAALPWLAAAAVVVAIAVVAGLLLAGGGSSDDEVVAEADLEALQGVGAGHAELHAVSEGELRLELDVADVDSGPDRYLEIWLLRPDVSGLVSLGPLQDDGVYDLPPGLDPAEYPVVDVSFEHFDGDPAHSGDSVLRGPLDFDA